MRNSRPLSHVLPAHESRDNYLDTHRGADYAFVIGDQHPYHPGWGIDTAGRSTEMLSSHGIDFRPSSPCTHHLAQCR